jgi:hypothetical protein
VICLAPPDDLSGWPAPTDEQLRRLRDLVAHPARLRYFFGRLENPLWLARLADDGWYAPERVPEPITEADQTARITFWPLSDYLRRVAGDVPETAASVVGRLVGTANPIVQRDLVAALVRLPAASAERFVDDIVDWTHGRYSRMLDERDLGNLAVRLLNDGQTRAGQRLASAILSWLQGEYWLGEAVEVLTGPLARSGIDGVLVFADALDRAIGDQDSAELASYMRASIADHEQDQHADTDDHLINGLRDSALTYLRRTRDPDVLQALLRRRAVLYRRIAYYVAASTISALGEDGTAATSGTSPLVDYARSVVLDKAGFDDSRSRLEYGALSRAMLPHLTAQDIQTLAGWLRQGPPMSDAEISQMLGSPDTPAPPDLVVKYREHWRADRMALLGPDLPAPLAAIAAELAAGGVQPPDHPGFSHWISVDQSIESPVSHQQLSLMSVAEVIDLARNYQPPAHQVFRFPEQALAQQISSDVAVRPGEYSLLAINFADLSTSYVNAFFEGLRQAVGTQRKTANGISPEPQADLSWEPVLALAADIASKQDPGGRNSEQPQDSPRWIQRSALMLLKTALGSSSAGLPAENAWAILEIIRTLLDSPDPVREDETAEDRLNPADRALNSVRGQAVSCLIAFCTWWHRLGNTEDDAPTPLPELLSRELDLTRETSAAIRTVYGQRFPTLYTLLPAWTTEHAKAMFGPPAAAPDSAATEPPGQSLAEILGQAAFDAYLLTNGPHSRIFLALLRPYYEREISKLRTQPARAWRSALRDSRQTLLDHLLLLLLWNTLRTDDPLIKAAIRKAGVQDMGEAIGHLGWVFFHEGEAAASQAQAAQEVWTWWRQQAQRRSTSGNSESAVAMVSGFLWWWRAAGLDKNWQIKELLLVLEISPSIETPGLVAQTFADRVTTGNEADVVTALEIILDNTADDHQLQYAVMNAQPALRRLLGATDPEIRRRAIVLVQKIAAWGMVELAKQITALDAN